MTTPRIAWIPIDPRLPTLQPLELVHWVPEGICTVRGLQLTYKNGQTWLRKGEFAQIPSGELREVDDSALT